MLDVGAAAGSGGTIAGAGAAGAAGGAAPPLTASESPLVPFATVLSGASDSLSDLTGGIADAPNEDAAESTCGSLATVTLVPPARERTKSAPPTTATTAAARIAGTRNRCRAEAGAGETPAGKTTAGEGAVAGTATPVGVPGIISVCAFSTSAVLIPRTAATSAEPNSLAC